MIESILIGIVIALAAIILIIIVVGGIKGLKSKNRERNTEASDEEVPTYVNEVVEEKKEEIPMKIVIAQGESVVVGSEGKIPCGEYILESCDGAETFNVRIGRYVKEYSNGARVILTEKQKVTPVSTSIILR